MARRIQTGNINNNFILPNRSGANDYLSRKACYCNLYLHENAVETDLIQNTYVHLTGFTQGLCQNTTLTTDEIVVIIPGVYKVDWSISSKCSSNNQELEFEIFVNEVGQGIGSAQRTYGTINQYGNSASNGILTLKAGDNVDIRVKNTTSDANIVVSHASITILKVA